MYKSDRFSTTHLSTAHRDSNLEIILSTLKIELIVQDRQIVTLDVACEGIIRRQDRILGLILTGLNMF